MQVSRFFAGSKNKVANFQRERVTIHRNSQLRGKLFRSFILKKGYERTCRLKYGKVCGNLFPVKINYLFYNNAVVENVSPSTFRVEIRVHYARHSSKLSEILSCKKHSLEAVDSNVSIIPLLSCAGKYRVSFCL